MQHDAETSPCEDKPAGLMRGTFESTWGGAAGVRAWPEQVHTRGETVGLRLSGKYQPKHCRRDL